MDEESKTWDDLYSTGEFLWKDPHELVIDLVPVLKQMPGGRILDLGCGAGRHLVYLNDQGFPCYGTDHAWTGLEIAKDWLSGLNFNTNLCQSQMHRLPYASGRFIAVICLYVIYHGTVTQIERTFKEIHRVLRPDGLALVTFISDRHHRFGNGEEIEPYTFITTIGADAGIPHHFNNEVEMRKMVDLFEISELRLLERLNEEELIESHWAMLLRKTPTNQT